jgi:hypothetical protein
MEVVVPWMVFWMSKASFLLCRFNDKGSLRRGDVKKKK